MINKLSSTQYKFDDSGHLVKADGKNSGGSTYYSQKLDAGISSKTTIMIARNQTVGIKRDGRSRVEDVDKKHGGGVTVPIPTGYQGMPGGGVFVVVTGNPNYNAVGDIGGKPQQMTAEPEQILMHEIVGHAVPMATARDNGTTATGRAVDDENIVRGQVGLPARKADDGDLEGGTNH